MGLSRLNHASPNKSLVHLHERRHLRVDDAWAGSESATRKEGDPVEKCRQTWVLLGHLVELEYDNRRFWELVQADFKKHGVPRSFEDFVEHYNRMTDQRKVLFKEEYTMHELLGEGAYAEVFRATKASDGSSVALKCVMKRDNTFRHFDLIEQEIHIWSRLNHKGVVRLTGHYELPSMLVLVTDICAGGCLLDRLQEVETMSENTAQSIGKQVVDAVLYLHSVGVCHRDIKPENVLCTDGQPELPGHTKLADFGLAAEFSTAQRERGGFLFRLIGTPEYLAPEIVTALKEVRQGRRDETRQGYDQVVDLWSTGCMLYELLAGEPPFLDDDDDRLYELIMDGNVRFPDESFESVSEEGRDLLKSLLTKDPEQRISGKELRTHPWISMPEWLSNRKRSLQPLDNKRRERAYLAARIRLRRKLKGAGQATMACLRLSLLAGRQTWHGAGLMRRFTYDNTKHPSFAALLKLSPVTQPASRSSFASTTSVESFELFGKNVAAELITNLVRTKSHMEAEKRRASGSERAA